MLSPRFKYIIGIGVGAGAYVLAKFAVSLPTPTQSQDRSLPGATHRGAPYSSSPPPLTSSSLRKVLFSFFPARKFPLKKTRQPTLQTTTAGTLVYFPPVFSMHIYTYVKIFFYAHLLHTGHQIRLSI